MLCTQESVNKFARSVSLDPVASAHLADEIRPFSTSEYTCRCHLVAVSRAAGDAVRTQHENRALDTRFPWHAHFDACAVNSAS